MRTSSEIKQYGYAQIQLESSLVEINSIREGIQLGEVLKKLGEIEDRIDRPRNDSTPAQTDVSSSDTGTSRKDPVAPPPTGPQTLIAETPPRKTDAVFGYFQRRVLERRRRGGFRISGGRQTSRHPDSRRDPTDLGEGIGDLENGSEGIARISQGRRSFEE